jgi:hypothetical protein
VTGRAGVVTWLTAYEDAPAMEAARRELVADPRWLELFDPARGCFAAPGIEHTIYRRLG